MREILPIIQKPSAYLGTEVHAVHKASGEVALRLGLAFPDLYEVGMSYLGQRILYDIVNAHEKYWAERVFAPSKETAQVMRQKGIPLSTLESDTPLAQLDVVAFSLTHELCYTNILYMLDLADLPLLAEDRSVPFPLVIAGGGACFNPEPVALFFDVFVLGDGEEVIVELIQAIDAAKRQGLAKKEMLESLTCIPGVYVPSLFHAEGSRVRPLLENYDHVEKRIVPDLNTVPQPKPPILPFGHTVHDRLTLEIARGCTRGCRFCQAGMIYRPVRERSLEVLEGLVSRNLAQTGYEELSFLSLSTGDFSALGALFSQSFARCHQDQVAISLPSLRVGSVHPQVMARMADIRRTGTTLAPEAGSQRLRNVINKGITEEELLLHTSELLYHGWRSVKLYFMIGLPTETDDDLQAILNLCQKIHACSDEKGNRLRLTVSISPFVPKPHTPFQWETQISLEEARRRLALLKVLFKPHRWVTMKWQDPGMSFLEGLFARGDRRLNRLVALAHERGLVFTSWSEHFNLEAWINLLRELDIDPNEYLGPRNVGKTLPWGHLHSGVSEKFLLREMEKAHAELVSPDCRYDSCLNCGVCNSSGKLSLLTQQTNAFEIAPHVNVVRRDQESKDLCLDEGEDPALGVKVGHYRIWYRKVEETRFLSQLELQAVFERGLRRAGIQMTFSSGHHPLPLLSFGRALNVGVSSDEEWFSIYVRQVTTKEEICESFGRQLPRGLSVIRVEELPLRSCTPVVLAEDFELVFCGSEKETTQAILAWKNFQDQTEFFIEYETRKGHRRVDARRFLSSLDPGEDRITFQLSWTAGYISPLRLVSGVCPELSLDRFHLIKRKQWLADEQPGMLQQ